MGVGRRVVVCGVFALIAVCVEEAYGQCTGKACGDCGADCTWCQAQLNDSSVQLNLGVGLCIAKTESCADHLEDEAFFNVKELGGFPTDSGTAAFELTTPGDCDSDYAVASVDTNTCEKCQGTAAHTWCGIVFHNTVDFVKFGGMCMGNTAVDADCATANFDPSIFTSSYVGEAGKVATCPTCAAEDNCGACYRNWGCQWCAPITTLKDPTSSPSDKLIGEPNALYDGLGACSKYNEACPATMGTVGNIFTNVPETDFIFETKVQRAIPATSQCPTPASGTVWSTYADCATCKENDHNWCFTAANVTIADTLYQSHGGICLDATVDGNRCVAPADHTVENSDTTEAFIIVKAAVAPSCTDPSGGGGSSGASSVEASIFASVVVVGGVMSLFA